MLSSLAAEHLRGCIVFACFAFVPCWLDPPVRAELYWHVPQARLREARDHGVALASAQAGMESALGVSAASGLPFQKVELEIPG